MSNRKNIWITGASSGIGKSLATALIEQGNFVIVSGRNLDALQKLESLAPERVRCLDFDLSDPDFASDLKSRIGEITDTLDMAILAAGVCEYVDQPDCGIDLYRRVMEVNFFAQVQTMLLALPLLKRSETRPQLVGVGSQAAHLAFPRAEAYGASKAAFEYWFDALRVDLSTSKIDLTLVSPGFVDTPLTRKNDFQMPSLMSLDDACDIILKGIQQRKRHVRFPLRMRWVLGLMNLFEGLWFGLLAPRMSRNQKL